MRRPFILVALIPACLLAIAVVDRFSAADPKPHLAGMPLPEYSADGALLRPTGFDRWVVVGTSIGLSYSDDAPRDPANPGLFHNVYLQPQAFEYYVRTGEFPEQSVFIVTNCPSRPAKGNGDVNRRGFFADATHGLEVSVKDSQRFEGGWGYFMFHDAEAAPRSPAESKKREAVPALPQRDCFDCHAEHARQDNVFTQFYSVLNSARANRGE